MKGEVRSAKWEVRSGNCVLLTALAAVVMVGCIATSDVKIQEKRREEQREQSKSMPATPALAVRPARTATNHLRFWWQGQLYTNQFGVSTLVKDGRWATQYWTIQASADVRGSNWVDLVTTNRMPAVLVSTNHYAFYRSRMDIR